MRFELPAVTLGLRCVLRVRFADGSRMIFDPAVARRDIVERLAYCSSDELRVLSRVLAGIEHGREQYGPLDIARDARDFGHEAEQELRDALFYMAAEYVARDDIARERRDREMQRQLGRVNTGLAELARVDLDLDDPEISTCLDCGETHPHFCQAAQTVEPIGFDEEPDHG